MPESIIKAILNGEKPITKPIIHAATIINHEVNYQPSTTLMKAKDQLAGIHLHLPITKSLIKRAPTEKDQAKRVDRKSYIKHQRETMKRTIPHAIYRIPHQAV